MEHHLKAIIGMWLIAANTNLQLKYKEVATPNTPPQKVNFLREMARPCILYARHYIIACS